MIITSSPKNKQLLGENNKSLNRRMLTTINLDNSILMIDLAYYSALIDNKLKYNSSFRQKWAALVGAKDRTLALQAIDDIFEPIVKLKRLVKTQKVMVLSEKFESLNSIGKELYKLFASVISDYVISSYPNVVNMVYSLAVRDKQRYLILSDNIDFWAICNKTSDIHMAVVTKNNNIKLYSDKFGLEYLSALIGTNKLVNKLRLSKLKYVNLQYLFVLLLYTKFKQVKSHEIFDLSDKTFLGSKGKALFLISEAHREISYYFLTKKDMVEIFLISSGTHFNLNLSRLLKITNFDLTLMGTFANYYATHALKQIPIVKIPSSKIYYKIVEHSKLCCFKDIQNTIKSVNKPLPKLTPQVDIKDLETSQVVDSILKGLAW